VSIGQPALSLFAILIGVPPAHLQIRLRFKVGKPASSSGQRHPDKVTDGEGKARGGETYQQELPSSLAPDGNSSEDRDNSTNSEQGDTAYQQARKYCNAVFGKEEGQDWNSCSQREKQK